MHRPRCGVGVAIVSLALLCCSVPGLPAGPSLRLSPTPTTSGSAAPSADPNGPDGGVEQAYRAFDRSDGAAFLEALDPTVRDQPGPLKFGNLLILDITGLSRDLSKTTLHEMHYTVRSTDGEWAEVGVQGVARSEALGKETPIAGVEIARQVQGRWVLSTAQARATGQADRVLQTTQEQPDAGRETGAPAAAPPPGPEPPYWRVVGEDGANLREAPSQAARILRELPRAEVVTNLDQEATAEGRIWRGVAYGPVEGWVAAALLVPQRD